MSVPLSLPGMARCCTIPMILMVTVASHADSMVITSWGGSYAETQNQVYFQPFAREKGIEVRVDEWGGELAKIELMVETGNYTSHVFEHSSSGMLQACENGLLEIIDYDLIGGKAQFLPGAAHDCAVGTASWSTIFAFRTDVFGDNPPTTIGDFFDLENYPGPRAVGRSPLGHLEMALLADGVPSEEVYAMLATDEGVERALAKLDTIRSAVSVWWSAGAQPPQLLADGEAVMSTAWNGRIDSAIKAGQSFDIVWDGQVLDYVWWIIPAGHPDVDLGHEFIAFASRPEVMAEFPKLQAYGPTVKAAFDYLDAETLRLLPSAPDNLSLYLQLDPQFWADNSERIERRYSAWLAQ